MAAVLVDKKEPDVVYMDQFGKPVAKEVAEAWLKKNEHKMVPVEVEKPAAPTAGKKPRRDGSCSDGEAQAVQSLITARGFSCIWVDFCSPNGWSSGLRVTCNGAQYAYTIVDRGGMLVVNVE